MEVVDPTGCPCLLPFYVTRNKRMLKISVRLLKHKISYLTNAAEVVVWL